MDIMEKRIELEKRGRKAQDVEELNLDNCRTTQISGLTDEFKNLKSLSLINVGLTTLKSFPNLPKLRKLELSDNRISGGLNLLHGCSKLTSLNLSGNKLKDIESLKPLKELKELRTLDLFNCEVTNLEGYRESVFELLKDLHYLDGFDRDDQEAEEDEEEGEDDGSEVSGEGENGDEVVDVDDEEDDEEDEEDDDEDDDGEVGLAYLQKPTLEDDSEGEDFEPGEGDDDDDDLDDDEEENEAVEPDRGVKRKRTQEDEDEDEKDD